MAKPRLCRFRKFWIILLLEAWVENYNTCGGVGLFTIIHNYKSVYKLDMKKLNYIEYNHAQHAALIFWIPRDAVHLLMQTPQHHMTSNSTITNQFPIERKIYIKYCWPHHTHTRRWIASTVSPDQLTISQQRPDREICRSGPKLIKGHYSSLTAYCIRVICILYINYHKLG